MANELERNIEIYMGRCRGESFTDMARKYKISPSRVQQIYRKIERQIKTALEDISIQKPVGKEERLRQMMRDFLKDMRDLNRETRRAISYNSKQALKITQKYRHKLDREIWNHGSCVHDKWMLGDDKE